MSELTEVAVPPSAQALVRQLEDLTGRIQARSLSKHHFLMGFQTCDDLVDGGVLIVVFLGPINAKFVEYAFITLFKWLSDIGGVSGVDFLEHELLFQVSGVICLVDPFKLEVDREKPKAEVLGGDVIRVFEVVLHRFFDGSGLQVAKVSAVFWLVDLVKLVHRVHSFAFV